MRVGVFGGSFDPPHIGHDMIIKEALKSLNIEILFIVPTWLNPFKKTFSAPPQKRLQWVKKLWEELDRVKICEYEFDNKRPTTSIETINYLYEIYPITKCFLLIGADNIKSLHQWNRYEELAKKVEFVVALRDGIKIDENLKKLQINANISSSKLRENLDYKYIPQEILSSVKEYYKERN